ncbi:MAG: hypothetical protein COW29_06090 [Rhodobacterales bacterium CG15_BIG_FIL_POST_REV_8_21_14_020_59_13]|nr:MAG: hypothetical protein COW29_06090 [Rhodobacterales bacterium CG15_BIG_FIL_POST_REV_8_21_14_020_59_13]
MSMQRLQTRLRLGYGLVFGGAIAMAIAITVAGLSNWMLAFPWSLLWVILAMIPSAGIALVFLTAVEERTGPQEKSSR